MHMPYTIISPKPAFLLLQTQPQGPGAEIEILFFVGFFDALNPLCTKDFFLLVQCDKFGMVHYI